MENYNANRVNKAVATTNSSEEKNSTRNAFQESAQTTTTTTTTTTTQRENQVSQSFLPAVNFSNNHNPNQQLIFSAAAAALGLLNLFQLQPNQNNNNNNNNTNDTASTESRLLSSSSSATFNHGHTFFPYSTTEIITPNTDGKVAKDHQQENYYQSDSKIMPPTNQNVAFDDSTNDLLASMAAYQCDPPPYSPQTQPPCEQQQQQQQQHQGPQTTTTTTTKRRNQNQSTKPQQISNNTIHHHHDSKKSPVAESSTINEQTSSPNTTQQRYNGTNTASQQQHSNPHNQRESQTNRNILYFNAPGSTASIRPNTKQIQYGTSAATAPVIITATATTPNTASRTMSKVLSLEQDQYELSPYQCLVQKQIEVFEQVLEDKDAEKEGGGDTRHHRRRHRRNHHQRAGEIVTQGQVRPVLPGQVGIRCRHCGAATSRYCCQGRGSVLFPSNLLGVYQVAQNMANTHLLKTCKLIPAETRKELYLVQVRDNGTKKTCKSAYGGGRQYWADSLCALGVVECVKDRRLYFLSNKNKNYKKDDSFVAPLSKKSPPLSSFPPSSSSAKG